MRVIAQYLMLCAFIPGMQSCSTTKPTFERGPLKTLVLRPRAGHQDKLTNQKCVERKPRTDICVKYDIREYDLNEESTRMLLRSLKFVCDVRGERYAICEKSRGLCQLRKDKSGWGPFAKTHIAVNKYLSAHDDYDFLIAADVYCAAADSEVGKEMFD